MDILDLNEESSVRSNCRKVIQRILSNPDNSRFTYVLVRDDKQILLLAHIIEEKPKYYSSKDPGYYDILRKASVSSDTLIHTLGERITCAKVAAKGTASFSPFIEFTNGVSVS